MIKWTRIRTVFVILFNYYYINLLLFVFINVDCTARDPKSNKIVLHACERSKQKPGEIVIVRITTNLPTNIWRMLIF